MAIMRSSEVRELDDAGLEGKLAELRREYNAERGMVKSGGRAQNPGRIRELSRTIARVLTIVHEKKLGIKRTMRDRRRKGAPKPAAAPAPEKEKESKESG